LFHSHWSSKPTQSIVVSNKHFFLSTNRSRTGGCKYNPTRALGIYGIDSTISLLDGIRNEWGTTIVEILRDFLSKADEETTDGRLNAREKCQRHPAESANEELRMSYIQNGNNGHINGSHRREVSNEYDGNIQDTGYRETGLVRRAGGYGGLMSDDLPLPADHDEPLQLRQRGSEGASNGVYARGSPDRREISHDGRRRSTERDGSSATIARTFGSGPGGSQIQGQMSLVVDMG